VKKISNGPNGPGKEKKMANIDELKVKVQEKAEIAAARSVILAETAGKKAKSMAKIAKLKSEILTAKEERRKAEIALGRKYYELFGEAPAEELAEICATIGNANDQIDAKKALIDELKSRDKAE
jgi:hypothetical protein